MTNLLYGNQYLYRFGSGSSFIGVDLGHAMRWAILTPNSIANIWFEKEGGTTAGDPVLVGDSIYLGTQFSNDLVARFLITDARGYLRWDIISGSVRGLWQMQSPGINAGQPIPIYANVTFGTADALSSQQWLAQESGEDYLQLSSTALTLASTDT